MLNAAKVAKDYYGNKAKLYDKKNVGTKKWDNEQNIVKQWLSEVPTMTSVLDVPCGTGRFFSLYEKYNLLATGYDISTEMLNLARNNVTATQSLKLYQRSIFNLQTTPHTWYTSVCTRLLNFFTEDEAAHALECLCNATRQVLIFSMRTGKKEDSSNRCNVHDFLSMTHVLNSNNFKITHRILVGENGYCMYKAVKV